MIVYCCLFFNVLVYLVLFLLFFLFGPSKLSFTKTKKMFHFEDACFAPFLIVRIHTFFSSSGILVIAYNRLIYIYIYLGFQRELDFFFLFCGLRK